MPDTFVEGKTQDLWIEFKYITKLPAKDSTIIDLCNPSKYLSALQQLWLKRRNAVRGDTLVILGHTEGCVLYWKLEWEKKLSKKELLNKTIPRKNAVQIVRDKINE